MENIAAMALVCNGLGVFGWHGFSSETLSLMDRSYKCLELHYIAPQQVPLRRIKFRCNRKEL